MNFVIFVSNNLSISSGCFSSIIRQSQLILSSLSICDCVLIIVCNYLYIARLLICTIVFLYRSPEGLQLLYTAIDRRWQIYLKSRWG